MKCTLCGCNQSRIRHCINSFEVRECRNCHLVFVDPLPGERELALYYQKEYPRALLPDAQGTRVFTDLLARLRAEAPNGRLLEIGCSWGTLLREASDRYECVGVEVSSDCAKFAREQYGLNVYCGTVEQFAISQPGRFDVVLMRHSLEHTRDPRTVLSAVRSLTSSRGTVVIIVPNLDSASARLFGRYWEWMTPPAHLYYFSKHTLCRLLQNCGFVPFHNQTSQGDAMDFFLLAARVGFHVSRLSRISHKHLKPKLSETIAQTTRRPDNDGSTSTGQGVFRYTIERGLKSLQSCCKPVFKFGWKLGLGEQLEVWSRPEGGMF